MTKSEAVRLEKLAKLWADSSYREAQEYAANGDGPGLDRRRQASARHRDNFRSTLRAIADADAENRREAVERHTPR